MAQKVLDLDFELNIKLYNQHFKVTLAEGVADEVNVLIKVFTAPRH